VTDPSSSHSPRDPTLRIGFAGTPPFAARLLQALITGGYPPAVAYTQPDRPAGRGRRLASSAVKSLALQHGLEIRQPASLRSPEAARELALSQLDVLVVAAYGLLLPPAILAVPEQGCINVHPSLLPRWRGAAPIERAILAGDSQTGVCIMAMDPGLDTGPVYASRHVPIGPEDDTPALEIRLAEMGGVLLLECLAGLSHLTPTPQPEVGVRYADKLTRRDAIIDWKQPAEVIERQVRALASRIPPYAAAGEVHVTVLEARAVEATESGSPGTLLTAGRRSLRVACGEGALELRRIRLSVGKGSILGPADALNGYPELFSPGRRLETPA
jgi:methionyl-tRNA formyltransferase